MKMNDFKFIHKFRMIVFISSLVVLFIQLGNTMKQSTKFQINTSLFQLKIKSNGHSIYNKIITKNSMIPQIQYHIRNYKLPININLTTSQSNISNNKNHQMNNSSYFGSTTQNINTNQKDRMKQQFQGNYQKDDDDDNEYDIGTLSEQINLFNNSTQQQEIQKYIEMEKLLAHNVQEKLTKLCKALMMIAKKYQMLSHSENSLENIMLSSEQLQQTNITKQKLNEIQQKCMRMLNLVQEERRKIQMCVICWTSTASVIFMPCMHFVICKQCSKPKNCPICKSHIQQSVPVYR